MYQKFETALLLILLCLLSNCVKQKTDRGGIDAFFPAECGINVPSFRLSVAI